jgi:hypothetical protein
VGMAIDLTPQVVILQGSLPDLKQARDVLGSHGIEAAVVRPPGCGSS